MRALAPSRYESSSQSSSYFEQFQAETNIALIGLREDLVALQRRYQSECLLRQGTHRLYGMGVPKNEKLGFEQIKQSADLGNAYSQWCAGHLLSNGIGCSSRLTMAARYYKLSAHHGDPIGQNKYGTCLLDGIGVAQDESLAAAFYRKSAEQNDSRGQRNYAIFILMKRPRHPCAEHYLLKSAEAKDRIAQHLYGRLIIGHNARDAMLHIRAAADQDFAPAQTLLAISLLNGIKGLQVNIEEGKRYLSAACTKGCVFAEMVYGYCYDYGMNDCFGKNLEEAEKYYKSACDRMQSFEVEKHGLIYLYIFKESAMDLLPYYNSITPTYPYSFGYWNYFYGLLHEKLAVREGNGGYSRSASVGNSYGKMACARVAVDKKSLYEESIAKNNSWARVSYGEYLEQIGKPDEARELFRVAAERGNPSGQYHYSRYVNSKRSRELLHDAAEQGHRDAQFRYAKLLVATGTDTDPAPVHYSKLAADQGHADAQVLYGGFLYDGRRCEKSFEEAAFYFRRAALQENADGEYQYALCLLNGDGVEKNETLGTHYLQKAAEHGNAQAAEHEQAQAEEHEHAQAEEHEQAQAA